MAKLYFKYGAMGSSKTAQALITKYNYEENGLQVWLIKPSADVRDGADVLRSRIGLEAQVQVIAPATDVYRLFVQERAEQCDVVIVAGSREKAAAYIHRHFEENDRVLCFAEELPLYADCRPLAYGEEAQAETLSAGLFAALRELDDPKVHRVYARCPVGGGVAYAVQNRLKKAAAFRIIDAEADETPLCKGRCPEGEEGL